MTEGMRWSADFNRTREKTERTRQLRQHMTDAERKLWWSIGGGQMQGLSFRRQHPAVRYILDFYCAPLKLAIEVDGGQHNDDIHLRRDGIRDAWLASKGVEVLRFWNTDVLRDTEAVLETIWHAVAKRKADLVYRARGENPQPNLPPFRGKEHDASSFGNGEKDGTSSPCKGEAVASGGIG